MLFFTVISISLASLASSLHINGSIDQFIGDGFFANEMHLLLPICKTEQSTWWSLMHKERVTFEMSDHGWLADYIELELRYKRFYNKTEHRELTKQSAQRFARYLGRLLHRHDREEYTRALVIDNYRLQLFAGRIFHLIGKVVNRTAWAQLHPLPGRLMRHIWSVWSPAYNKFFQRLPGLQYEAYAAFFNHLVFKKTDSTIWNFIRFSWLKVKMYFYEVVFKAAQQVLNESQDKREMAKRMIRLSKIFQSVQMSPKEEAVQAVGYWRTVRQSIVTAPGTANSQSQESLDQFSLV